MSWRAAAREALATPVGNSLVRGILGPLRPVVPAAVRRRLPFRGTVRVPVPGQRFITLGSDGRDWIAARVYWNGPDSFEPETTAVFDRLVAGARCVFDVGAYSGWYALRAAAAGGPATPGTAPLGAATPGTATSGAASGAAAESAAATWRQVHAFEAVPDTHERLVANARANRLENLRPVWAAVGESDGETRVHAPTGADLPTSASTLEGFRTGTVAITVPALSLDTYVSRPGVALPDLIKIDVEGGEPAVLRGARRTIESARPFVICEVLAGMHEPFLQEYFGSVRYRAFHLLAGGPLHVAEVRGDPAYRAMNYLFAPEEERGLAALA